jgi:hypothetical protein
MNPTFIEIWTSEGWMTYFYRNAPAKTREYYKFRSVCRMAFWIPLVYVTVAMFLSLGA